MSKTVLRLEDPQFAEKLSALLEMEAPPAADLSYLAWLDEKLLEYRKDGVFNSVQIENPVEIRRVWVACWTSQEIDREHLFSQTLEPIGLRGMWIVNTYALYLPVLFLDHNSQDLYNQIVPRGIQDPVDIRRFFTHALASWGELSSNHLSSLGKLKYKKALVNHFEHLKQTPPVSELPTAEDLCSTFSEVAADPEQVLDLWSYLSGQYSPYSRRPMKYRQSHGAYALVPRSVYKADADFCIHDPYLLGVV